MKLITRFNRMFFGILMTAGLAACSHGPAVQEFSDSANPSEEIAKLDNDMHVALNNQVDVLSPHYYKKAHESLSDAKESLDKQKENKRTLHGVAEGRAYLVQANQFSEVSHAQMDEVIIARQQALTAGAAQSFAEDFRSADNDLRDVTSDIEKSDLKGAKDQRIKLQAAYLGLELKAIKQASLGSSRDKLKQAVQDGAKEFAPRSLVIADTSIQNTDAYITANRHETVEIAQRSAATQANADHLLKITHESKAGKKTSSEETALQMERGQTQVQEDRLQLADKQVQLENKQTQLNSKQGELSQAEGTSLALAERNKQLKGDQAFNRSFEEARAEFSATEAEVYKQGNTLTIRLRGLEFPVAQAVLKGSNFPLLAKVQKVIKEFGKSTVVVEGHTDSIGGKAVNEKLSNDRALAVRDYLMSNAGDAPSTTITAIGYDYQKPLATNKTSAGRAQNRRVDILIQAEKSAEL